MHSLWLALLACVLIFQDAYLVPPTVTGAPRKEDRPRPLGAGRKETAVLGVVI